VDDSRELLSYRAALVGLIVSILYTGFWLTQVEMELKAVLVLIPAMFVVYLGATKIVADSGLIYTNPSISSWDFSVAALGGAASLDTSTHVAMGVTSYPMSHYRAFIMVPMAHINRLADFVPHGKRRLFWGVCGAFIVGMVASTLYTIWLGYTLGAYNFQPNWLIINSGRRQFETIVMPSIQNPEPMQPADIWFFVVGAVGMILLNVMRYRFIWWPLHPVGFALSGMSLVRLTGMTIFVAWAVKYLLIRIGGAPFYRRSKPFFIGMLIAYILAVAAGIVVDSIWFPTQGHEVHRWY
jgi:hypothetical protein